MSDHEADLAAWVVPLAGDARTGVDARYDAGYELIRAELAKLDAVSSPPVDWDAVRQSADALLRARSKDLFVGAALTRALHVKNGLAGLALGLALLARLAGEFGAGVFPTRARARVSALKWLSEQVSRALADYAVVAADREAVTALEVHLEQFLQHARALLGDDAPSFAELRDAVARMQLSLPVAAAPTLAVAVQVSPSQAVVGETTAQPAPETAIRPPVPVRVSLTDAPPSPASIAEVGPYLSKTGSALADAARTLWRNDRSSPLPYRLLRTALWMHLDVSPPHDASGVTSIPAPEERLQESLPAMLRHGAFAELLEVSEATLSTARFWLDLHFFCDRALEGLGASYAPARAAASAGVRALLERMPGLLSLSFADGTPLARAETRSWLSQRSAVEERAGGDQEEIESGLDDLRVALRGASAAQALHTVEARRHACGSARARFVVDLAIAGALADASRVREACALYEALDAEVVRHGLEVWEPALSLSLLTAHLRCLQRVSEPDAGMRDGLQSLRRRVAKLSPSALVSLGD
ncbi:MAG: type VI secretion system protein TssA [Polyangiales bacterium]